MESPNLRLSIRYKGFYNILYLFRDHVVVYREALKRVVIRRSPRVVIANSPNLGEVLSRILKLSGFRKLSSNRVR